jgi:hypothetical protein
MKVSIEKYSENDALIWKQIGITFAKHFCHYHLFIELWNYCIQFTFGEEVYK